MSLSSAERHRLAHIERDLSGDTVLTSLARKLDTTSSQHRRYRMHGSLPIRGRSAGRATAAPRKRHAVALTGGALCLLAVGPLLLLAGALADVPGLLSVGGALLPLAIGGLVLLAVAGLERHRKGRRGPRSASTR
jgi:hypothetical protein